VCVCVCVCFLYAVKLVLPRRKDYVPVQCVV